MFDRGSVGLLELSGVRTRRGQTNAMAMHTTAIGIGVRAGNSQRSSRRIADRNDTPLAVMSAAARAVIVSSARAVSAACSARAIEHRSLSMQRTRSSFCPIVSATLSHERVSTVSRARAPTSATSPGRASSDSICEASAEASPTGKRKPLLPWVRRRGACERGDQPMDPRGTVGGRATWVWTHGPPL